MNRRRRVWIAAWTLLGLAVVHLALFLLRVTPQPKPGLVALYTAAHLAQTGSGVERFYDDEWFQAQVRRVTPTVRDIYRPHPPTALLIGVPFVALGLDYWTARWVWAGLSLMSVLGAVVVILRHCDLRGPGALLFLAGLLTYGPLRADLALGQTYGLLLSLMTLAWYGYRRDQPAVLGIPLGLLLVLKAAGPLLWLFLVVRRRWQALAWATGTVLCVVSASLPWLGLPAWRTYGSVLIHLTDHPSLAVTAYQTQLGFCRHLFTFDPVWNPAPLGRAPWLSDLLWVASVFGFLIGSLFPTCVRGRDDAVWATLVTAGVILNPYALDYHYTLLALPVGLLLPHVLTRPTRWTIAVLTAAALLTGLNLPYKSPGLAVGAWALLAYPKLYGAWLLWGLGVWQALQGTITQTGLRKPLTPAAGGP